MAIGPSITVTDHTGLRDLKDFLDTADGANIRGKQNDDGSTTLYAVDRAPSFWSNLTGKAERRNAAAQTAIASVLTSAVRSQGHSQAVTDGLISLTEATLSRPARTDTIKQLLSVVTTPSAGDTKLADIRPRPGQGVVQAPVTEISGHSAQIAALRDDVMSAGTFKEQASVVNKIIGPVLGEFVRATPERALELGLSDLKAEITSAMGIDMSALGAADKNRVDAIIGTVADKLQDAVLGTHADPNVMHTIAGKREGETLDLPAIRKGDQTFLPEKFLGQGGFNNAIMYVSEDRAERFVLKVPRDDDRRILTPTLEGNMLSQKQEFLIQKTVVDSAVGENAVLGLEGAVRMPDGMNALMLEVGAFGEIQGVNDSIAEAVEKGVLTDDQAKMIKTVMAQDMLIGLAQIETAGFAHGDIKLDNFFVTADGIAKPADLGEATVAGPIDLRTYDVSDGAFSPEVALKRGNAKAMDAINYQLGRAHNQAETAALKVLTDPGGVLEHIVGDFAPGGLTVDNIRAHPVHGEAFSAAFDRLFEEKLVDAVYDRKGFRNKIGVAGTDTALSGVQLLRMAEAKMDDLDRDHGVEVDMQKHDVFQVASHLVSMIAGTEQFVTDGTNSDQNRFLTEYGAADSGPALGKDVDSSLYVRLNGIGSAGTFESMGAVTTGNDRLDAVLNEMLKPDPDDRITMQQAAAFIQGTTTPEQRSLAHDLIKLISTGADEEDIQAFATLMMNEV
jgi:serine/threonine protein kinase